MIRRSWWRTVLMTLVASMALTGCVSIPDSSAPQPIQEYNRVQPGNQVPVPRQSDDPETLVRNFVKAMADPSSGHRAARRFMSPGAGQRWDDQGPMTVIKDVQVVVDERSESAVRLRVLGEKTGILSQNGQLTPDDGEVVLPLNLVRTNRRWRVNGDQPAGSITDDSQFGASYRPADLFFADRTATRLVNDPRWLFGNVVDPTEAVTRLLAGPSADLSGAVGAMGGDLELRGPVSVDGDSVSVNLGGLPDSDTRSRTVLAAQIVWTLAAAGVRGTYFINADGTPLVPERSEGWTTADVEAFNPNPDPGDSQELHLIRDGALLRAGSSGIKPVAGALGTADDLRAAAVSAGQTRAAGVADRGGRQVLLDGEYGKDPAEVTTGVAIETPGYGPGGDTGYAVVDGRPIQWTVGEGGRPAVTPLDVSQVGAVGTGPIQAMKVSPDGVRVALIVGGRVLMAAIATNDRGVPALTGVHPVSFGVDSPVVSIDWGARTMLYLAREGDVSPVMRIPVSGLPVSPLVSGNLKAPVTVVAADKSQIYAADLRGVMDLGVTATSADSYWTAVGDAGPGAIPVTPAG